MAGEINPEVGGVLLGRARDAEFTTVGRRQFQQTRSVPDVTAASEIEVSKDACHVKIEGTTTITKIKNGEDWFNHLIILRFGASCTVQNGNNLKLKENFAATVNDTLTLISNGTNWYEVARSANA